MIDVVLLWVGAFGVWPLADPGHTGGSLLSMADVALHVAALTMLGLRWKVVRR